MLPNRYNRNREMSQRRSCRHSALSPKAREGDPTARSNAPTARNVESGRSSFGKPEINKLVAINLSPCYTIRPLRVLGIFSPVAVLGPRVLTKFYTLAHFCYGSRPCNDHLTEVSRPPETLVPGGMPLQHRGLSCLDTKATQCERERLIEWQPPCKKLLLCQRQLTGRGQL
jgi:hypothetical protein